MHNQDPKHEPGFGVTVRHAVCPAWGRAPVSHVGAPPACVDGSLGQLTQWLKCHQALRLRAVGFMKHKLKGCCSKVFPSLLDSFIDSSTCFSEQSPTTQKWSKFMLCHQAAQLLSFYNNRSNIFPKVVEKSMLLCLAPNSIKVEDRKLIKLVFPSSL